MKIYAFEATDAGNGNALLKRPSGHVSAGRCQQLQLEELQALDTEETGTAELDADRLAIEAYEEWMRKRKIAEVKSELGRLLNKREEAFEEWRLKTLKAKAADISGIPAPFKVNFL